MKFLDENNLSKKSKKLVKFVNYVNNNWKDVLNDSINVTAQKNAVSTSTVNRFIVMFNFKKYQDFKMYLYDKSKILTDKEFAKNAPQDILKLNDQIVRQVKIDFENSFSSKVLNDISTLVDKIIAERSVNILYNFDGTFLSQLFRYELNRIGIKTVISKGQNDYAAMAKNTHENDLGVSIVFSDKKISNDVVNVLNKFKHSVLITRKINSKIPTFSSTIKLFYASRKDNHLFDDSKYFLHTLLISNIISLIKLRSPLKEQQ